MCNLIFLAMSAPLFPFTYSDIPVFLHNHFLLLKHTHLALGKRSGILGPCQTSMFKLLKRRAYLV